MVETVPEIRVIEIITNSLSAESVSVVLHTVLLADCPEFALISYARDGLESQSITCNGRSLSVSPKLVTILRSLRDKNVFGVQLFWIDVICLTQDGMQDIYTQSKFIRNVILRAKVTIGWPEVDLSRETAEFLVGMAAISHKLEHIDKADGSIGLLQNNNIITLDHLRRYESLYREATTRLLGLNAIVSLGALINPLTLLGRLFGGATSAQENFRESNTFLEIRSLLDSGYFGRMLALPDFVLSESVAFRCGLVDLRLDSLCRAVYAMVMYGTHGEMKSSQVENVLGAYLLRQHYHSSRLSFAESLLSMQGCNFEESHTADFVFPLLALSNGDRREHELPTIDYSDGEQRVLQSISTAVVKHFDMPINLSLAGLPNEEIRSGYPSWLPEFGPKQRMILAHPNSKFSASKISNHGFAVDPSFRAKCYGAHVDTVANVKSYMAPRRMCDQYDLTGDNLFELVRWYNFMTSTEIAGGSDELVVHFAETIQAKGSNHIWERRIHYTPAELAKQTRAFIDFLRDPETPETIEYRLFYAACLPSHDRRFGQTTAGRFCLLPSHAEAQDIVCIVRGFKVPILLRRTDSGYQNVGECYVHGIMHGEAAGFEDQIILLE